jgi:hypothetical protein
MKKSFLFALLALFTACKSTPQVTHLYPMGTKVKLTYAVPALKNPLIIDSMYAPPHDYWSNLYFCTDANGRVWAGLDDRYLEPVR